ncbi:MAG: hypothetical protein HXY26_05205 [Hydrogenophilaceae bacterium]|nr:hypothetical protein [Hydrogenophilaceae bacterium]
MPSAETLDQATGLRRLLGRQASFHACAVFGPDPTLQAMALASLAYALARRGESVVVLDEAESPHNVATQYGLAPRQRLADLLRGRAALDKAVVEAPGDVRLILTGPLAAEFTQMSDSAWDRRLDDLIDVVGNHGWLLVNTRPGVASSPLAAACTDRLLVLPDKKSVLTEAYALLKSAHQDRPDGRWRVLVMNRQGQSESDSLFANLTNTAQRFLGMRLEWFGSVPKDEKLAQSMRLMRPLLEVAPECPGSLAFKALAEAAGNWGDIDGMDAQAYWQRAYLLGRVAEQAAGAGLHNARLDSRYG